MLENDGGPLCTMSANGFCSAFAKVLSKQPQPCSLGPLPMTYYSTGSVIFSDAGGLAKTSPRLSSGSQHVANLKLTATPSDRVMQLSFSKAQ